MKVHTSKLIVLILFGFGLTGCSATGGLILYPEPVVIGSPPHKHKAEKRYKKYSNKRYTDRRYDNGNYRKGYVTYTVGRKTFRVPPGHMPRRGECRIWYYNRPPGHQPAPGPCRVLRRHVSHNAVIIRG